MLTLDDVRPRWIMPATLALHFTPWWMRGLGFPKWRFILIDRERGRQWVYLTKRQYIDLFRRVD